MLPGPNLPTRPDSTTTPPRPLAPGDPRPGPNGTTMGGGSTGGGGGTPLDPTQQSAYDFWIKTFQSMGFTPEQTDELLGVIRKAVIDGLGDVSIQLALRETNAYKQRFVANEMLRKAGMPLMDEAQIVAQEAAYRQALAAYGLPVGFYDDPTDFANWIVGGTSPAEVSRRAQLAYDKLNTADPSYRQALKDYYGVGDAEIVAFFLDKEKAQPILEKQAQQLEVGAAARRQGLALDLGQASDLIDNFGVDQAAAQQGFSAIADVLPDAQKLADIDKVSYTQEDAMGEVFKSDAGAADKRRKLASRERARFSGSSGVNKTSLSQKSSGQY